MEVSVSDDFGIFLVCFVGVDVCKIGFQLLAVYGEVGGIEYMDGAVLKTLLYFVKSCLGAFCCCLFVNFGKNNRTGLKGSGPVCRDLFACCCSLDREFEVRSPVDSGRNDEGVRSCVYGASVVGNVRNACILTCGRSAHGVSMLGDQYAAVVDQVDSAFLLCGLIVPGTGEGNFHCYARALASYAKEEGGVSGDNFCIGECAYVADLGLIFGDLSVCDHLVELHACCNACKIAAFVDGSERVMIVRKGFGMSLGSGCMTELHFREFHCGLDHEIFMSEAVCEDDAAACVYKVCCGLVAFLAFRYVGFKDDLVFAHSKICRGLFRRIDEVEVVSRILVMKENEADLHISRDFGCFCESRC